MLHSGGPSVGPLSITTLPFHLEFDGSASAGVLDRNGVYTGFTDVLASPNAACGDSSPTCDDPLYPYNPGSLPYYIPGKILMQPSGGGTLTVTSTDGDNVLALDDQDNALSVEIDASSAFVVSARILPPVAPNVPDARYEGGGIYWGWNASNYVKLVYAYNCDNIAGTCLGVQLASEIGAAWNGGTKTSNPELPYPSFTSSLDLYLIGNPGNPANPSDNTARACYSVDGGPLVTIETRANIPDSFFAASEIYAGIATTNTPYSPPNGGTPFDTKFDAFSVERADADGDGYLTDAICGGNDCDDADPNIHPGAAEQCNAKDDDCDGATDEDWNCDDADACTTDFCSAGTCDHTDLSCDDAVACTDDSCDSVTGCHHVPNNTLCQTGQICDVLQGCITQPECLVNGDCADGLFCNGAETCVSGDCVTGTPPDCDDGNVCTDDSCNEVGDACAHDPRDLGTPCSDGNLCNGAETCDDAGTCVAGTLVNCGYLDGPCSTGVCNPSTGDCESQVRADLVICGDDGDPCDGEDVCRAGSCSIDDTSVSAVELAPLPGVTDYSPSSTFRARDIADNNYAPRFYTRAGDPDYTASDYAQAQVTITFTRSGTFFEGHLEASGLKPNFAYQVKLGGMPTMEFGSAGDDVANERIGYAGRWHLVGGSNATDAQYNACKADPNCTDIYEGYLVFDLFATDRLGGASMDFKTDQSLHVLWRDCPTGRQLTGCASPAGRPTIYQDVVALASTGYGYNTDYQTWNIGVFGEVERQPPQAYLPDGEYRARFFLTEESFHESGIGGQWASTVGETGIHFWIDQTAGLRDCDDGDICNGYESCDAGGVCRNGVAVDCDDQNVCTDQVCDAKGGCWYADRTGSCDDGNYCTTGDACSGGDCSGAPLTCPPGLTCDPAQGCVGCDSDAECDDDLYCNGAETCDLGTNTCLAGAPPACSDGLYCNGTETCNETTDSCQAGAPPACDDGLYCNGTGTCNETTDSCQAGAPPACDDGQYCDGAETCNETTDSCQAGTAPNCSDGNSSTVDYCDPAAGACAHAPLFDPATGVITDSLWVSGMELGGIGAGKMEMRTNGEIGNYTINNNWDREVATTKGTFFAIHVNEGGIKQARVLRRNYNGGSDYSGLDNMDHLRYLGMFPKLTEDFFDNLPVSVRLSAFSPLIPQNAADSSLPVAFFTYELTNRSSKSLDVSVAFSWQNILGRGGYDTWGNGSETWNSINGNYQENVDLGSLQGVRFRTTQSYGAMRDNVVGEYLVLAEKGTGFQVTTCNSWNTLASTPPFWSEFTNSGTLSDPSSPPSGLDGTYSPAGALGVKTSLAPSETKQVRFLVVWYMPNQITLADGVNHGHAYLNNPQTDTANEIAQYAHGQRTAFLDATTAWQQPLLDSNLPFWLKLRMINGLFTMFSNTVYPQDQHFYTHESLVSMGGSLGTMDQRMSFHPYYTMMFPQLDQSELTTFGDVQPANGAISHFNGNVGYMLHSANVGYGITHWPDLSCSYVMQVLKSYKWTGNMSFLDDNWQDVKEAMAWLQTADGDGDYIPEGGSTYDYEGASPGAFIYTASSYLGALKAAEEMAKIKGETAQATAYSTRFNQARSSIMTRLWTGEYFKKYYRSSPYAESPNSFIASLAGDWLSRLGTTGRVFDPDVAKSAENRILNYHQDLFPGVVAPMEVTPTGGDPANNCYQFQHEPFIGMESIYDGYVDEGLQVLYEIYKDHWEKAKWPWNGRIHPSVYGSGKTGGWNGNYYMSNPATWGVLSALSGSSLDVPNGTLYMAPRLPSGWTELHIPLYFPAFWGRLDFDRATGQVSLSITKTFGAPIQITKTVADLASGVVVENTTEGVPFTASEGQVLVYHVPVDSTPPAAVGNLTAAWVSDKVHLRWTAPGDDGSTGRSLRYDIRYSLNPITEANWSQASQVTREPYPAVAGSVQEFDVPESLTTGQTYFVALKSKDEEGNWSPISNIANTSGASCFSDPECSDGLYCNGAETCVTGLCTAGTAPDCSGLTDQCNTGVCDETTDQCKKQPVTNGTSCNDSNACTQTDTCQAGACAGTNPVVCTALDQCHDVGVCNTGTGLCSNPVKANGTSCNDGNACTQTDTCQAGACTGSNPVVCTALDQCHDVGVCNTGTGVCSNPAKANGTSCNDGNACTQTDTCQAGACAGTNPVVCTALDQCHDVGVCDTGTGLCSNPPKANGAGCNDSYLCTHTDVCTGGVCAGVAYSCNDGNVCTNDSCDGLGGCAYVNNTAPCDDGAYCNGADTCSGGGCSTHAGSPCLSDEFCNETGDACCPGWVLDTPYPYPTSPSATPSDGWYTSPASVGLPAGVEVVDFVALGGFGSNLACEAGHGIHVCIGVDPGSGEPCWSQVYTWGPTSGQPLHNKRAIWEPGTGASDTATLTMDFGSEAIKKYVGALWLWGAAAGVGGTGLGDSWDLEIVGHGTYHLINTKGVTVAGTNWNEKTGVFDVGVITGVQKLKFKATNDPWSGRVTYGQAMIAEVGVWRWSCQNDTQCSDGLWCDGAETCAAGVCTPGTAQNCSGLTDQCNTGVCNETLDQCQAQPVTNGTACNDSNACTQPDTCQAGVCTGSNPVVCTALDQCHDVGVCDMGTGLCSNPPKANGTSCDDSNACTRTDTCQAGACTGSNPVVCTALDQCHDVGVCDTGTGVCSDPPKENGSACDDSNACTHTDTCSGGTCGGTTYSCDDGNVCTADLCDGAGGCQHPDSGICFDIQGRLLYYRDTNGNEPGTAAVGGASVGLQGTTQTRSATSDLSTGSYGFLDLISENITVTPTKIGNINGVSSLDAARISQYRVGLYPMSAAQLVAGDVSGNGSVSSYDASLVSQYRVGLITRLPVAVSTGSDWAFSPSSRTYAPLASNRSGEDYVAILYGDVTGNWVPPGGEGRAIDENVPHALEPVEPRGLEGEAGLSRPARPSGSCTLSLRVERPGRAASEPARLVISGEGCQGLLGLDIAISHSRRAVSVGPVVTTSITPGFTVTSNDRDGLLRISLFSPRPLEGNGDLLTAPLTPLRSDRIRGRFFVEKADANEGALPVRLKTGPGAGKDIRQRPGG